MLLLDGKIPMRWWDNSRNFGDLLGPWLVSKMTGREVQWVAKDDPHYLVVGSILGRVSRASVVWGVGSFGSEGVKNLTGGSRYLAVRGPLTRARLEMFKHKCPRVYGDPALLAPDVYKPDVPKTHELGIVLRWSETKRKERFSVEGVKVIDLLTDDIEGTIDQMLSCENILTTSLHGMILADAYHIPNAWLIANTGYGKEHKFWDYLLSVGKEREPAEAALLDSGWTLEKLLSEFNYDGRPVQLDLGPLRESNPFLERSDEIKAAEKAAIVGSKKMRAGNDGARPIAQPAYLDQRGS